MKHTRWIFLLCFLFFLRLPLSAQTVSQQALVCKITHSANDPVVPISGVQVVVNGMASPKSASNGQLQLAVRINWEKSYTIEDLRMPQTSKYVQAWPMRNEKLYVSQNVQRIALITPEERDRLTKENFNRLMKKYKQQGQALTQLSQQLAEQKKQLETSDLRYQHVSHQLDSVNLLLESYHNNSHQQSAAQEIKELSEILAITDYQSLDEIDAQLYDLKMQGDWPAITRLLNKMMKGNPKAYVQEAVERQKHAQAIIEMAEKEWQKRLKRVEDAATAYHMLQQNDSVARYLDYLLEVAPNHWEYWVTAANIASVYQLDNEKAEAYYQYPLDHHANSDSIQITCHAGLGELAKNKGDYEKCEMHNNLARDILIHSKEKMSLNYWSSIYSAYGVIAQNRGELNKALDEFHKALQATYDYPDRWANWYRTSIYTNIAVSYMALGDYNKALEAQLKGFDACPKDGSYPHLGNLYIMLSNIYHHLGDMGKMYDCGQKALEAQEQNLGKDHPYLAQIYNQLAMQSTSNFKLARDYYLKAIAITIEHYGESALVLISYYNNLAYLFETNDQNEAALKYYEKTLQVVQKNGNPENNSVGDFYQSYAMFLKNRGEEEQYVIYMGKAIEILSHFIQFNNVNLPVLCANLSYYYLEKDDYENSLLYAEKGIEYGKNIKNADPEFMQYLYMISEIIYRGTGKIKQADKAQKARERIEKNVKKENSEQLISQYLDEGEECCQEGKREQAQKYYLKALAIVEKNPNTEIGWVKRTYSCLGEWYYDAKDYAQARLYYGKELNAATISFLDRAHYVLGSINCNIAYTYIYENQPEKAIKYLEDALVILEADEKNNPFGCALTYGRIGYAYGLLKQKDKGIAIVKKGFKAIDDPQLKSHEHYSQTRQSLNNTFQKISKMK